MYLYLAIAIILSLLSGKLMKLVKLPNVTGYLVFGLLAGPYCLNIIPGDIINALSIIPNIALGFIAFTIGAEFKLSYLKMTGKTPIIIAFTEAFGAVIAVDAILILTGNDAPFSLVLGAIAAATAPAATLMVVRQYKAKGPVTNTLLPVVAIDDAVALMAFGLSVAVAKAISSKGSTSLTATLLDPVIEIIGALFVGALLGVLLKFTASWFTGRGNRLSAASAFILLCIGISEMAGFSSLLTCMSMSAVFVNLSNASDKVMEQVDRFTPPVFMLFFFISGAGLDISILPSVGIIGLMYVIFRIIGKIVGTAFGAWISHAGAAVKKYLGYTLVPQAGVAIGLAGLATEVVPEYGSKIRTIILSATVIYELTGPVITKLALKKAGEII